MIEWPDHGILVTTKTAPVQPYMNPEFLTRLVYRTFGVISIGNALWMLASSTSWFRMIPGVEDSGEINPHFVRDVGIAYLLCGVGALWCAANINQARYVHIGVTAFISLHALLHIIETLTGHFPADHWYLDFPLVIFPAILLIAITPVVWNRYSPAA